MLAGRRLLHWEGRNPPLNRPSRSTGERRYRNMTERRVWLTWEHQRRSIELAAHFGCELVEILEHGRNRYPRSILRTFGALRRHKPHVAFVQNPSMILSALVVIWGAFAGVPVVVDRHSTFMLNRKYPPSIGLFIFKVLNRFTLRFAALTVVTNEFLAQLVRRAGGRAFILPDKLPSIEPGQQIVGDDNPASFLVVGSFADDEPLAEVIEAVSKLPVPRPRVFVSGKLSKAPRVLVEKAAGVLEYTDYLPDADYVELLRKVDGVVVLTTADHTMLCGCYEAVAAERMLVTSDKQVLREYFSEALFVDNSVESIRSAFSLSRAEIARRADLVRTMKARLGTSWHAQAALLDQQVSDWTRYAS